MKAVSGSVMRGLDRATIESGVLSGIELMNNAANVLAEEVIKFCKEHSLSRINIICGKGNNGGDGFALAPILQREGFSAVTLYCAFGETDLQGDALLAFEAMSYELKSNIRFEPDSDLESAGSLCVDALLGTGLKGEVRAPFTGWIDAINLSKRPVISVDIPSGLDSDKGKCSDYCVKADMTVTFELPKKGLLINDGPSCCGILKVRKIGIPRKLIDEIDDFYGTTTACDLKNVIVREDFATWKNRRGHVLVIGGSRSYPSAPFLSAEAALRAGAGLVTVVIPESCEVFCNVAKGLIVRRVPDDGKGVFTHSSVSEILSLLPGKNSIVLGMGLDTSPETREFLEIFCTHRNLPPWVCDADGLNLLSQCGDLFLNLPALSVITPHAGEMRRILSALGLTCDNMLPHEIALCVSGILKCAVIYKGCRSVITSSDGDFAYNLSGCPALSTAGSGDVLSGFTGAFLAGGLDGFTSARCGAYIHGRCGEELIRGHLHYKGFIADDLINSGDLIARVFDNL